MNELPDKRVHAYREDLACETLRGLVSAPRYATGRKARINRAIVPLYRGPDLQANIETQTLYQEEVTVFDDGYYRLGKRVSSAEGAQRWAWVQLGQDRYVGYLPYEVLNLINDREIDDAPSHRVAAAQSLMWEEPDITSAAVMTLHFMSEISVSEEKNGFCRVVGGGYISANHIVPKANLQCDYIASAERFLGTPYLWGGKTRFGIDCSGLVQVALQAAGYFVPRDSDMQAQQLGEALPLDLPPTEYRRGDLLFWPGHVAFVYDENYLLHASGHYMKTLFEPMEDGLKRVAGDSGALHAVRRIDTNLH